MTALAKDHSIAAKFLLDSGADVLAFTTYGKFSALSISTRKRSKVFVERVLEAMMRQLQEFKANMESECNDGKIDNVMSRLFFERKLLIAKDIIEVSLSVACSMQEKSKRGAKPKKDKWLGEIIQLLENAQKSVLNELDALKVGEHEPCTNHQVKSSA